MGKPEGFVTPDGRRVPEGEPEGSGRQDAEPTWVPPSPIDALGRPPGRQPIRLAAPGLAFWSLFDRLMPS